MAMAMEPRFLLADDMGLGKTIQAIRAAVARDDVLGSRVVVCPASARPVWDRELKAEGFSPIVIKTAKDIDILATVKHEPVFKLNSQPWIVITMSIFRSNVAKFTKTVWPVGILIHDEAQNIKDISTESNKAVTPLALRVPIYWPMTGTPVKNHYGELFGLARIIVPHKIMEQYGIANEWGWKDKFCELEKDTIRLFNKKTRQVEMRQVTRIAGSKNPQLLRNIMGPYMLRRTKKQVLKNLPELRWQALDVETKPKIGWTEAEITEIEKAVEQGREPRKHLATKRATLAMSMAPAALSIILDHIEDSPDPIIVFCSHLEPLHWLQAELAKDHRVAVITGSTPIPTRGRYEADFQNGKLDVILGQTLACGTAITLTKANRVLFIDLAWSPMDNAQARDRAHRIGQDKEVLAQYLNCDDPVCQRVNSILARKIQEIERLME